MTGRNTIVKCAKCGITSKEDSSITFHRFPLPSKMHGPLMAKVWAKYCFSNDDCTSEEYLSKLYAQHKMLCGKHFDDSSYLSSDRRRLNSFAIPTEAQGILAQLREEQSSTSGDVHTLQLQKSVVPVELEVLTATAQCSKPIEHSKQIFQSEIDVAGPSTSQSSIIKDSNKRSGILKGLDVKKYMELTPRKQKLYKQCRKNLFEIIRLRSKFRKEKKCKRSLLASLTTNESINEIMRSKLNSSFYLLLQSQLKNVPRKLHGRRWTLDDKVLALSIYKKSSAIDY